LPKQSVLTAIQDQDRPQRNYKKYILKQPRIDELCRRRGKESETILHITAASGQVAPTEYVKRHDGLGKVIHRKLAEQLKSLKAKVETTSRHQPMFWRMTILSCIGTAAYLRTKQHLLTDLT
jgi:hypothetical protein